MPAPSGPAAGRRSRHASDDSNASYAHPGLRVSDADRGAVADQLSRHYGDGRLSQTEFEERLDQAMNAKIQADLSGLLTDLPGAEPPAAPAPRPAPRPAGHRILAPLLVIAIIITTAHIAFWTIHLLPWLLIGLLAFLWLRYSPRRRRHIP
jgi:hypothetical protein